MPNETDGGNTSTTSEGTQTADTTATSESTQTSTTEGLDNLSIDDLMNMDFSGDEKLSEIMSTEHTGLPTLKEILLKGTTEQGRKLISNLRSSYTKKTTELAQARKDLDNERRAIQLEKEALYSGAFAKKVKETAAQDISTLDPYDQEQLMKIIEIESAKKLEQLLSPMQTQMAEQKQIYEAERFITAHPDMKTEAFKAKLVPLIKAKPEMDLETAYWMVKGQLAEDDKATAAKVKEANQAKTKETRQQILKTAGSTNVGATAPPKNLSPYEALQWFKNNKK